MPTFLGVTLATLMANRTHDMGLSALLVDGVTHRLAIDGQALIEVAILGIPGAQGPAQLFGINPY